LLLHFVGLQLLYTNVQLRAESKNDLRKRRQNIDIIIIIIITKQKKKLQININHIKHDTIPNRPNLRIIASIIECVYVIIY